MALDETLRRLPPAALEFAREILDYHWSEAEWLYARREVLHEQGSLVPLPRWAELEERAAAHVRGLVRGGRVVLDECEERALEGTRGEINTAVRLMARGGLPEPFDALVDAFDWYDVRAADAVVDALIWEAPESWQQLVGAILEDEDAPHEVLGPMATTAAVRGWDVGDTLVGILEEGIGDLAALADAVGMQWVPDAFDALAEVLESAREPRARRAVAMAALQLDAPAAVDFLARAVGYEAWATIPLAVGAGPDALPLLRDALVRFPSASEPSIALGLLGHVAAVDLLLGGLEDEERADAAAQGLYLLTGAELHEETTEVEDDDEEGEVDDEVFGLPVGRLTTSQERWQEWLEGHGTLAGANDRTRLRLGVPFEPGRVLDELLRTGLPPEIREVMACELSIRYRLPRRYSSRLLVPEQRGRVARLRVELQDVPRLEPGAWYVAGRPLHAR